MVQTIVNLNGRIADLTSSIADMKETIFKLENMVKMLSEKIKDLKGELVYEKKLRSSDSDSSNLSPLIKN